MKKSITTIILIMAIAMFAKAQDEKTIAALSTSYQDETNKEYAASIAALENVYDANSYLLNLRLGWLYYLKKEYAKSQEYYKKAIALEPKSIEARLGYVSPTSALEKWDDVLKTYKDILVIDPNNSLVNYRVGYIYYFRKNFVEAEKYLVAILKLYPFDYDTNALLGANYLAQGKIKEAKKYYSIALAYNPNSKEILEVTKKL